MELGIDSQVATPAVRLGYRFADRGQRDGASTDSLSSSLERILPALERFIRFDEPETTALNMQTWCTALEEPLPQTGAGADAVLSMLTDTVIPNGLRVGDPAFSGWVATMPTDIAVAAHLASALAGPLSVGVQTFNLLENLAARWLASLIGLPAEYRGIFTPGGSIANLIGLGVARQYAGEARGLDISRGGVHQLVKPRIYASSEIHHCIHRAAAVLGLGRAGLVLIPADENLRMDVAELEKRIQSDIADGCTPVAVVASTGTTSSGAIDPLAEIAAVCKRHDVWLHVDGAYGMLGILDEEIKPRFGELSDIDSLVIGPSKWLATSMGCGSIYVRDGALMERAFTLEDAVYLEGSQPIYESGKTLSSQFGDFGHIFHPYGVEHSLPSRGVEVWAVLKEVGAAGIKQRVMRHNRYARHLAERILETDNIELGAPVELSTVCFRYVPDELKNADPGEHIQTLNRLNGMLLAKMRERGHCLPSATVLGGRFMIRACFVNPRTSLEHIEMYVSETNALGREIWHSLRSA